MRHYLVCAVLLVFAACSPSSMMTTGPGTSTGGTTIPPAAVTIISISGYAFAPQAITITAGSSVRWVNDDVTAHTSMADAGAWSSGQLSAPSGGGGYGGAATGGGTFQRTFTSAGTFTYHCANHSYMTGTITVTP